MKRLWKRCVSQSVWSFVNLGFACKAQTENGHTLVKSLEKNGIKSSRDPDK